MAKSEGKAKKVSQKWRHYEASGDKVDRKNKHCPKCGDGVFLAKHADRMSCGKCGYTESPSKPESESKA